MLIKFKHRILGHGMMKRIITGTPTWPSIHRSIQTARKTMYSLMGAGLHGRRGLNPLTSYKIWECFGLPRATYGLESVKLAKKDVDSREKY